MAPKGMSVRPLADRVKESLFSILRHAVVDSAFLDLCAGSGNVGIEALSRGAGAVTFIDRSTICIRTIARNLEECDISTDDPQVAFLRMDALKGLKYLSKNKSKFDVIFLGPPYHSKIILKSLQQISELELLFPGGLAIAEHHRKEHLPDQIHQLMSSRRERYGDTMLSFYI